MADMGSSTVYGDLEVVNELRVYESLILPNSNPTTDNQATRKKYVDDGLSGKSDTNHNHTHASTHVTGGTDVIANAVAGGNSGLMTGTDKTKLDGIAAGANNYVHPANHAPSIITQDASNRFVTDTEKTTWNGKPNLGGTSATAYRGDHGLAAYNHISSDGSSHTFINQGVTTTSNPTFANTYIGAGDGSGIGFWGGTSNYSICMSATSSGTHGGSVTGAATSDYNMYFKMLAGTNRGFVFKSAIGNVAQIESSGKVVTNGGFKTNKYEIVYNSTENSLDFVYTG